MQCGLGDFTHRIPGQSFDKLQCFGDFVGGHFSFTPVFQLFIVETGGRFERDESSHGFSPGVVCNADNGNFSDGFMGKQNPFDFKGRKLVAA